MVKGFGNFLIKKVQVRGAIILIYIFGNLVFCKIKLNFSNISYNFYIEYGKYFHSYVAKLLIFLVVLLQPHVSQGFDQVVNAVQFCGLAVRLQNPSDLFHQHHDLPYTPQLHHQVPERDQRILQILLFHGLFESPLQFRDVNILQILDIILELLSSHPVEFELDLPDDIIVELHPLTVFENLHHQDQISGSRNSI